MILCLNMDRVTIKNPFDYFIGFCLKGDLETEHRKMSALMRKFRIDISDVIMIEDIHKRPEEDSMAAFNDLIDKFRQKKKEKESNEEGSFYSFYSKCLK